MYYKISLFIHMVFDNITLTLYSLIKNCDINKGDRDIKKVILH